MNAAGHSRRSSLRVTSYMPAVTGFRSRWFLCGWRTLGSVMGRRINISTFVNQDTDICPNFTKLEVITEAEETGNVQKLHKLPSPGEMETEAEIVDNTFAAENYGEMEDEAEIVVNSVAAESYSETQTEA
ncbi:hypothetical protein AVEN_64884-1 [Araneus ventricosus]|uniref:Uncharacterized protein n=1 Tax=Araneus ventricosus TaxID=182803 RepID=A0A4Y2J3H9_ARAVE|nr:hypothetical protein AVEN_64884-1 [Araneus ventricosus]